MTRARPLALLASILLGAGTFAAAGTHPQAGTRGADILNAPVGVRPLGMGNAFSAVADDLNALYRNPAGLGFAANPEISANGQRGVEGIRQSQIGLLCPLGRVTSSNVNDFGGLAIGALFLDYGTFSGRDATGNPAPDFLAKDGLWSFGYGKSFGERISLGATVKRYRRLIANRKERGTASDAGFLFRVIPGRWNIGLSAFNLGSQAHFEKQSESLPKYIVGGVSYVPVTDRLTLAADVVDPSDGFPGYRLGGEWHANRVFVLRAGYDSGYDFGNGLTVGLGIEIKQFEVGFFPAQLLAIDYAFVPAGRVSEADGSSGAGEHNIALTLRFGDK